MIKHFNTAFTASNTTAPKSGKSSGIGTVVVLALLAGAVYFGYKYIQNRNQPVRKEEQE